MIQFIPETHTYLLDGHALPSVTQILDAEGFIDKAFYTEEGRMRGKYVHLAIHYYDTGELDEDTLDEAIVPYLDAWKKFLHESGFGVTASEVPMHNGQFAGTPDKILNEKIILDIKTGAIEPWVALQLAAYEILMNKPMRRFALRLNNDGTYKLHPEFKDRQDRVIFQAALACYQWKNNNLKGRR